MKLKDLYYIALFMLLTGCTSSVSIKNEKKGKLTASYQLTVSGEKKILLDDESAPKPSYMQMITGESGEQILTFYNSYKRGIFFYDYEKEVLVKKIAYEREGPDGILIVAGYYIKNMDSIYVYNKATVGVVLTDSAGHVKQRISLNNNNGVNPGVWTLYYPQYSFTTINPMFEFQGKLVMAGMYPFSIEDSLIHKATFTSCLDLKSGNVEHIYTYPRELYGSGAIWDDMMYTQAYPVLSPSGELIFSFPVSHEVYIAGDEGYQTIYAGSNTAGTIRSIDDSWNRRPTGEVVLAHYFQTDLYAGILYDPYRRVYYRIMMQGVPDVTINTLYREKIIAVIIMDEQFNYMGETVLGRWKEWNWPNSFVTSEGLMIEYFNPDLDSLEEYLTFKILTVEKL